MPSASVMQNGYSETDLRFAHPNAASAYGDITDDPGRQIFDKTGGGATFRAPPSGIQPSVTPWVFSGADMVNQVGTTCSTPGPGCAELLAILPNVTKNFCLALNRSNFIDNPSGNPPEADGTVDVTSLFTGTFTGTKCRNFRCG